MFFVCSLYETLERWWTDKKKSKRDTQSANVPETVEPDDRRDTTTSVAVEETVRDASRRRNVERVATVSVGNDGGTSDSTALTGHDNETIDINRLLVMLETLTNKMEYLENRFKTRMVSMEQRISRLSDSVYTVMPNSNVIIRVEALEAKKRKNDKLLNDLSGKLSACDQRLFDVETDYNYTKCGNRELQEMHDVLKKRMENLGAALNIDVNPNAYNWLGQTTSDDEMQVNQMLYGE